MPKVSDKFGEVIGAITTALRLLGGDSAIQAAVGSWRDGQDDENTLRAINEWLASENDRIAAVVRVFKETGYWEPNRRYAYSDQGCSQAVDWRKFLAEQRGL